MADECVFKGFREPTKGYFRMPNEWTDITAEIDSLAELKVIEYVLRHTWGYKNSYGTLRHITIDEFMHGKKYNGKRLDKGTKLSENAVKQGLSRAIEHGYILCEEDNRDKARVKKYYGLKMLGKKSGGQILTPETELGDHNLTPGGSESDPRTTNTDTGIHQQNTNTRPSQSPNKMGQIRIAMRECLRLYGDEHNSKHLERAHTLYQQSGLSVPEFRQKVDAAVSKTKANGGDMAYFFGCLEKSL